jgi:hypothetical protein
MDDDTSDYTESPRGEPLWDESAAAAASLPDVSAKNTKAEIIQAYQDIAKRYEANVKSKKAEKVKKAVEREVVEKASVHSTGNVTANLERLKADLAHGVDALAATFLEESRKMEDVQSAIRVLEERLKDLHDIEDAAVNIEDLLKTQEARKEQFAAEYDRMKLERARAEEEYAYERAQQRKKDEAERAEREAELARREEWFRQNEKEFVRLQKEVEASPAKLEQAAAKARAEAAEATRRDMDIAHNLFVKETEGERRILETRLAHFEDVVKRQNEEIISLKAAAERASRQVQAIAEKSLDAASGKQTLRAVSDIALHQAGGKSGSD